MSVGWDQKFAFDRSDLSQALRKVVDEPGRTNAERLEQLPYGKNKVDGYLNYLDRLGLYDKENRRASTLGELVATEDPGWNDLGTLLLLQIHIASRPNATVWYQMTHHVQPHSRVLSADDAERDLLARPAVAKGGIEGAVRDLGQYVNALTKPTALGSLRMLSIVDLPTGVRWQRSTPSDVPPLLVAYAVYLHRARHAPTARSVSLDDLCAAGGIGRTLHLHLDPDALAVWVRPLAARSILDYTQTAGLRDVGILQPDAEPLDFVRAYYDEQ